MRRQPRNASRPSILPPLQETAGSLNHSLRRETNRQIGIKWKSDKSRLTELPATFVSSTSVACLTVYFCSSFSSLSISLLFPPCHRSLRRWRIPEGRCRLTGSSLRPLMTDHWHISAVMSSSGLNSGEITTPAHLSFPPYTGIILGSMSLSEDAWQVEFFPCIHLVKSQPKAFRNLRKKKSSKRFNLRLLVGAKDATKCSSGQPLALALGGVELGSCQSLSGAERRKKPEETLFVLAFYCENVILLGSKLQQPQQHSSAARLAPLPASGFYGLIPRNWWKHLVRDIQRQEKNSWKAHWDISIKE